MFDGAADIDIIDQGGLGSGSQQAVGAAGIAGAERDGALRRAGVIAADSVDGAERQLEARDRQPANGGVVEIVELHSGELNVRRTVEVDAVAGDRAIRARLVLDSSAGACVRVRVCIRTIQTGDVQAPRRPSRIQDDAVAGAAGSGSRRNATEGQTRRADGRVDNAQSGAGRG